MHPQKSPAGFKFVIKSKLTTEQISGDKEKSLETNLSKQEVESSKQQITETKTTTKSNDSDEVEKKRKRTDKEVVPLASKKIHSQLQRWNQKKAELKEESIIEKNEDETTGLDDSNNTLTMDFGDVKIMACLLCQRKFKTIQDLQRHQQVSELHKKNLQDSVCVEKAKMKLRYIKTDAEQAEERLVDQNYRNRAAERRQAYGQPEKPVIPSQQKQKPITSDNVGARMLQQMGWRRGEGLGKDAAGIVNPIAAEQYAQGVGLGAAHSKRSISTTTNGSDSYKDRAKEMARRRYEEEEG
ncbi:hypothetical protein INT45_004870 [Circinella minor]|uniref:G-patch domain-containing protein n=1 Tax=Circinella minor TaxID=1195481 RepID=A0A8H7RUC3_9FUNG|nr:hypothetical protein INT45_004870 [Circinella minor]